MEFQPITKNVDSIAMLTYESPEVREAVKKLLEDYKGTAAVLSTLDSEDKEGPLMGSNIYYRNALVNILREITGEDILPISPAQSEIALANGTLGQDPREFYEDLGLAVYPKQGSNPILWRHLRDQIQSDFKDADLSQSIVIAGLSKIVKDNEYENGLRMDLGELSKIYNALVLNKEGNFGSADPELQKTGFPSKLGEGSRKLCAGNSGVCRLNRDGSLYLYAGIGDLANSNNYGRVHVAKNFSTGNNGYKELEILAEAEKRKIDERLAKARNYLLTGNI